MRIRGYLNLGYEPPAPFVKVLLISKKLHIRKFIDFHIDTGASSTVILDKDAKYLRLDVKSLKRAERSIGGIGGTVDTYLIEDTIMVFKTEEGMPHEERQTLLVGIHRLDKLTEGERKLIMKLPSLLGRDLLRKFRLTYDERLNEVFMER
ncbi:MAG: aspartyl protease family protein [Thermoproteota archaeon]|jgi:hypothetical protein